MAKDLVEILTPVGRIVQGSCFEAKTHDLQGNPLVVKTGPNAGQPRVEYFIALAIPKTDPGWASVWEKMHGVAKKGFPNLFDPQGNCISPHFAFKYVDGDSAVPNSNNIKPCDREGFPGHWVLNFTAGFPPTCYSKGGASVITNPEEIKRGYYVRIYGNIKSNENSQKPGIYLNVSMVELCGYGEEIISGPDGSQVFGGTPAESLPQGASETPLAPTGQIAMPGQTANPAMPGQTANPAMPGQTANPAMPGQTANPANVKPAPDFLNPQVEEKYIDSNGNAWTKEQLLKAGYSEAQIATLPRAQ